MDGFNSSYYKELKTLMSICGAWPYQSKSSSRNLRIIFLIGIIGFILLPEVVAFFTNLDDFDFIISVLPILSGGIMGIGKGFMIICHIEEIKTLLDKLQQDWEYFKQEESELLIIQRYAKIGRLITIAYTVSIYMALMSTYLVSYIAPVMDLILPLNESRNYVLIFPGDFYVHTNKHFFLILTMEFYGMVCSAHVIATIDALYMTLTLHCCGLFTVLSQRLEKLNIRDFEAKRYQAMQEDAVNTKDKMIYFQLKNCIKLHLKSIEYGEQLNTTFNIALLTDVAAGVFVASASAVKFVMSNGDTSQRIKYGSLYVTQSGRIFFNNLPGQLLFDHSSQIYLAASKSKWYQFPEKSKKLLIMIMMRSLKPCEFVVAGMITLNIELFSMVTRTCLSYCTIMLSTQNY
ncbi:odorant receptor Or2-like isoform X2 [Prorops nasuta]|uniref:odorant receptor Or2-like isoform X2 n=1 Tax=Prorops nasuta TaxID=863751 RepID=UPI0034CE8D8C